MSGAAASSNMPEGEVVAHFVGWLKNDGWTIGPVRSFEDVLARKGDTTLVAEVKGHTSEPGLDIDTMYGQILRGMTTNPGERYAVVVPDSLAPKALRVPTHVRAALNLTVYVVDMNGDVRVAAEPEG